MTETDESAGCRKCGSVSNLDGPATSLISARSAGVTGVSPETGPLCAACRDEVQHLYALFAGGDGLGFCGCGCPDDAYGLVRDLLELAPFREHRQELSDLLGDGAVCYFVLYAIDGAGLIDHGFSIRSSWLSPKGEHYLPLMRKWEHGEIEQAGYPHYEGIDYYDGGVCGPGCPHWEASTEDYRKQSLAEQEKQRAGEWQVIAPGAWTDLRGTTTSVLVKERAWIRAQAATQAP